MRGNENLKLEPVEDVKPFVFDWKTKFIPYAQKRGELSDKTHVLAGQLKEHYDGVANEDKFFAPFWIKICSFERHLKEHLTTVKRRRPFESFDNYLKRNDIEAREELEEKLAYFSGFYQNYTSLDDFVGKLKNELGFKSNLGIGFSGGFGIPGLALAVTSAVARPSVVNKGMGYFAASIFLIASVAFYSLFKYQQKECFENIIDNSLQEKAKINDKIIADIREWAKK